MHVSGLRELTESSGLLFQALRKLAKEEPHLTKPQVRTAEEKRTAYLKNAYGITEQEYRKLLRRQHGVCAICGAKPKNQTLAVDHDHETGKVRGLLCRSCNVALGCLKDDIRLLSAAIVYLEDADLR